MEEDLTKGEFVTEAELSVLRALWRNYADHVYLAKVAGVPISLVERVEALLFPEGF